MEESTKEVVVDKIEQTVEAAEEVVRHPYIKKLARLGFYAKAFLFLVIGILAILVAVGESGGQLADPTGALSRIAAAPFGKFILIIFIVGALGQGAWNILRGLADVDNAGKNFQGISKRVIAGGVGVFYLFLAWTAWSIIISANVAVENGRVQKTLTALLLALPLGSIFVFFIGLGVIGAGINECYSGVTGKFQKNFKMYEVEGTSRKFITILGILSFVARALIYALMGYYFVWAAINYNPDEAIGIDGALALLSQTYYGKTILFVTAVGVVCHGILSLYEAKYRRLC
jgi:hypothetical protein